LVDDYKIMIAVLFLNKKLEAFKKFQTYKEMVEDQLFEIIKWRIIYIKGIH